MWSVAAARAGYRLSDWQEGEYRNRGSIDDRENLRVADWDAEFLPVNDAKNTASASVLNDLASKLGATKSFVGRDRVSSRSTIDLYSARANLLH